MTSIPAALIKASRSFLEREAPRYTSYPSAQYFEPLGASSYRSWLGALDPAEPVGLYIHVPYCEEMCWFCGCNTKATHRRLPVAGYVDTLIAEIGLLARRMNLPLPLHSIHFGGGSPTLLTPDDLERIFAAIETAFRRTAQTEVSIEVDPRRLTPEKADVYAALGFNRASLGIQDTDPNVMRAVNREQPFAVVRAAADMLRARGIHALNVDMMYGLPHQTPQTIGQTLRDIVDIAPDRIAFFSYAHLPHLKKHQRLIDAASLPGTEAKAASYLQIVEALSLAGFVAIGIDHFAKPTDDLARCLRRHMLRRNFQGYSALPNDLLIGIGASAIGELDHGIVQNATASNQYRHAIAAGSLATARGWRFTYEDRMRRDVIRDLMCYFSADTGLIAERHGYPADYLDLELGRLAPFQEAGLVTIARRKVTFHSPLRMLVRPVAAAFDAYAARSPEQRYSKVA
jgi:oxygen-independent coproporphyrinogen-3 oxidase